MTDDVADKLRFGLELAAEAEKVILGYYRSPGLAVDTKPDRSPVTRADREAEQRIRELIERRYPDDSIIGEELGERPGSSGDCWILDPIDGTQSFVRGVPLFGTLIGLTRKNEPVAGVVNFPGLREIYYASKGAGAFWRPSYSIEILRATVSSVSDSADAVLCATSFAGFAEAGRPELPDKLIARSGKYRGWSDCYGHMCVATGRAEIMVDPIMNLWDCAALFPIVTEAGGHFFDFSGRAGIDGGSAVSTNAALFEHYRALFRAGA